MPADPRRTPLRTLGGALWQQRFGQINLACANCHHRHRGQRLAGGVISQAHATAQHV
jgi:sulfur-oxidizing protein SoxA